jgi:hypothetical protein
VEGFQEGILEGFALRLLLGATLGSFDGTVEEVGIFSGDSVGVEGNEGDGVLINDGTSEGESVPGSTEGALLPVRTDFLSCEKRFVQHSGSLDCLHSCIRALSSTP